MRVRFRQRATTENIYACVKPLGNATKDKLYKEARRAGELDTGYHIIIHNDGSVEYDRDINAIAQYDFIDNETSIYCLLDAKDIKHITDAQKVILEDLTRMYRIKIKYVEV